MTNAEKRFDKLLKAMAEGEPPKGRKVERASVERRPVANRQSPTRAVPAPKDASEKRGR